MGFASVVAKNRRPSVGALLAVLDERLGEKRVVPPLGPDSTLRASSLSMLCPREEVISSLLKITREDRINADSVFNFELGHSLHERLQEHILPRAGLLYGEWVCAKCEKVHGGMAGQPGYDEETQTFIVDEGEFDPNLMILRPDACEGCGGKDTLRHREQSFLHRGLRITGHNDGFLKLDRYDGFGILELKSIGARGAMEVRRVPKYEHVLQAQLYMWFTGLKWGLVVYWDKGTFGLNGLIEHYIERDEEVITAMHDVLRSIWGGIEKKVLPERICANALCDRAMSCAVRDPCFDAPDTPDTAAEW